MDKHARKGAADVLPRTGWASHNTRHPLAVLVDAASTRRRARGADTRATVRATAAARLARGAGGGKFRVVRAVAGGALAVKGCCTAASALQAAPRVAVAVRAARSLLASWFGRRGGRRQWVRMDRRAVRYSSHGRALVGARTRCCRCGYCCTANALSSAEHRAPRLVGWRRQLIALRQRRRPSSCRSLTAPHSGGGSVTAGPARGLGAAGL